ncbi:MAG TPA: methyltransferase domain-containing protein [Candidatus Nanoarchaeia archaeon]|nr:methyltransferase domain-containing protein [Candidatus Nanoarchaeia archaeon]
MGKGRGYYDQIADGYDELHGAEQVRKLRIIREHIPKKGLVLDIGCATGLSILLGNVMGLDPSMNLLRQSKIPVVQGVGEFLPFRNRCAECVICVTALHNFSDYKKGIEEMARVSANQVIISLLRKSRQYKGMVEEMKKRLEVKAIIEDALDDIYVCEVPKKAAALKMKVGISS